MKAIVYSEYGSPDVLKLKDVDKPIPNENEILVKVNASTVTAGTMLMRIGKHPYSKIFTVLLRLMSGVRKPKKTILGYEVAGIVESVGKDVKGFNIGDEIFGTTTGLKAGAYAEYVCLPENWNAGVVAKKPANLTFEEAAAVPIGGMTALYLLNKANIKKGAKVLIYGASGSVGSYAVQLAKYFGAEVTGVCSAANLELVKSIGADNVIDYTKEDYAQSGMFYDVIFDAVGKTSKSQGKRALKDKGSYLTINTPTSEKTENLLLLKELCEAGDIKPVIDKCYALEQTSDAHRYSDTGHKKGNVVITISE